MVDAIAKLTGGPAGIPTAAASRQTNHGTPPRQLSEWRVRPVAARRNADDQTLHACAAREVAGGSADLASHTESPVMGRLSGDACDYVRGAVKPARRYIH